MSQTEELEDDLEALRETEVAWLSAELGRSIANLAYPVGCGVAPTTEHMEKAANALFDRYLKMVRMAHSAARTSQQKASEPE